jgi:integrase/recombinase XerD
MITTETRTRGETGPRVLRPQQVAKLLAVPDRRTHRGRRDAALLATMVLSGLRVHEAVRLTRDTLYEEHGLLRLEFAGKGGRRRTVTLPPTGARALRAWLADDRAHPHWVFPGRRNEHLSIRRAQATVKLYCRVAGMPWVHAHSLRHTCASTVMRATGDLHLVQNVMGHASPTTTSKYYLAFSPRDADRGAEAMERALHPRRAHAV